MSRKKQDNDAREESLTEKQKEISNEDSELREENSPGEEKKLETGKSPDESNDTIEEVNEQVVDEVREADAKLDDDQKDEGFERKPPAPVSGNESSGKGMAGTAMGLSLLALAGTGYNLYDSNTSGDADTEQVAVDYSGDITSIQEQIESLMSSQQELSAMATSVQSELASVTEQVEQAAAAVESASVASATEDSADEVADTSATVAEESATPDSDVDTQIQADADANPESESAQQIQQAETDTPATLPSGEEFKQMAMEQVNFALADANKRLGLNEAAQLLSIGEQRLALAGDVGAAQAAFSMADQRLSEISDPAVGPVRESIGSHLAALENLETVDKNALTQELASLSASVDSLAFKPLEPISDSPPDEQGQEEGVQASSADETQSGDTSLSVEGAGSWIKSIGSKVGDTIGDVGSGIASDLKSMVTIQKTGPLSDVLLAPEQQYFVRENIKLQLASAQRAVLQDSTGVYQQSLSQAQSMLSEFFDSENEDVQSVSTRLQELGQIDLEIDIPDVSSASASLDELLKQLPPVGNSETGSD